MLPPRRFGRQTQDRGPLVSPVHRKFIRTFLCSVWKNDGVCDDRHVVDCAHVRTAANSGTGIKPSDLYLLPLCRIHHREQHNIGQPAFERKYAAELGNMTLTQKAIEFAVASPDRLIREAAKAFMASRPPQAT